MTEVVGRTSQSSLFPPSLCCEGGTHMAGILMGKGTAGSERTRREGEMIYKNTDLLQKRETRSRQSFQKPLGQKKAKQTQVWQCTSTLSCQTRRIMGMGPFLLKM